MQFFLVSWSYCLVNPSHDMTQKGDDALGAYLDIISRSLEAPHTRCVLEYDEPCKSIRVLTLGIRTCH
jgi:hypothetical protein